MFHSRTLFVVGAGASFEYGMPIGSVLKDEISGITAYNSGSNEYVSNEVSRYREAAQVYATKNKINYSEIVAASNLISSGLASSISIDNFLHTYQSNKIVNTCGKIAISIVISKFENKSKLHNSKYLGAPPNLHDVKSGWALKFLQKLYEGVELSDVDNVFNNVSFIVFNYDRCFEWIVYNSLVSHFNLDEVRAKKILSRASIIHPYGTIGNLFDVSGESRAVRFGEMPARDCLLQVASEIQTFTEFNHNSEIFRNFKYEVENAKRLVFLGFGYIDQNMKLFKFENENSVLEVYGTTFEMSDDHLRNIQNIIPKTINPVRAPSMQVNLRNMTCAEFFDGLSRIIAQ